MYTICLRIKEKMEIIHLKITFNEVTNILQNYDTPYLYILSTKNNKFYY